MRIVKLLLTTMLVLTACAYGAIQLPFSADLSGCVFTNTDALNGTYTGNLSNCTGEMSGLSTVSGTFSSLINPDGTVYVLTSTTGTGGRNTFTVQSNQLVDLAAGTLSDGSNRPTTYTSVTLVVKNGVNKGTYVSKSAGASGTTSAMDFTATRMSIAGSF